jgi:hypothetical protein
MFKFTPVPHLVYYVDDLGGNSIGRANAFVIRLGNRSESNYQHELMHVKQWYMTIGMHGLLYKFVPRYKLWAEAQAYRKAITYGRSLDSAAYGLKDPSYGFNLTLNEAKELLSA